MVSTLTRSDDSHTSAHTDTPYSGDSLQGFATAAFLYRREIERFDLISAEEVISLAQRMERGRSELHKPPAQQNRSLIEDGEEAQRHLVEANLRLVLSVAWRYRSLGVELPDLIQEGNLGLIHATELYDWRKGYRFATYAIWWIRQAITRAVVEQACLIIVPFEKVAAMRRLDRVRHRLAERMDGSEPTLEELASAMDTGVKQIAGLLRTTGRETVSLDRPHENLEEGDDWAFTEWLEENPKDAPENVLIGHALEAQLQEILNTLPPRERLVIELRFGLNGWDEHTLIETGRKVGLSYETVRHIEARALQKLEEPALQRDLYAYLQ